MNVERIVVGVDDSAGTARMLAWLADAVAGRDVDVVAVFCVSPLLGELFAVPPLDADRWKRDSVAAFEQRWCAPLRNAGVSFRTRVVDFEAAEGLQRVADQEAADLIVVGSHGHGRFGQGAVPGKLVGHATRPLLVVPSR